MFEHLSIMPRRYGEDAVRKNPLNRKVKLICTPEFEELFNSLFSGVDFDNAMSGHSEEEDRSEVARNKTPGKPFKWRTDDDVEGDDDIEEGYIGNGIGHEPRKKEPPSIFDYLDNGGQFKDICSQAFGLDDKGDPIPLPEDGELDDEEDEEPYIHEPDVVYSDDDEDEEDDVETETKNPFVFIANRLTFLAQTVQPIIFDTSLIETGSDYIKIAVNEDKTFPKIRSLDELGLITCKLNCCQTIRDEIGEFVKGTEYTDIFCFPEFISKDGPGSDVWAIKFICYKRK